MAFSRALSVISIISVSWFAAVGCGDDDSITQQPGASGEGGEAGEGAGGTSLGGTTNGGAGNGGTGGAGESGNGTGGTAGDAGAGVGGQPVIGGAGGEPPVTPVGGAAGEGGAGGAGGEGPLARAAQCGNSCEEDEDCFIDELNPSACDPETKRCYPTDAVTCVSDTSCIPNASLWFTECQSDNDCAEDDTERCVSVDGTGYCALLPGPDGCDDFSEATELPVFGSTTAKATVCASVWDRCRQGTCYYGCGDPLFGGFCGAGAGDTCNEVTGTCECAIGAECAGTEICQADKQCAECVTDQDCIDLDAAGLDKCVEGKCGCSAASACPDLTESATPVCE